MIFYYNSERDLKLQSEELLNTLTMQLNTEQLNLKILLECLKHLNSVIQTTNNFENPTELINLLREIKENLDNTRTIISDLEKLKNMLSKLKSKIDLVPNIKEDDVLISELDNYNKLASTLKNKLNTVNSGNLILRYIQNTEFALSPCSKKEQPQKEQIIKPAPEPIIESTLESSTDQNTIPDMDIQSKPEHKENFSLFEQSTSKPQDMATSENISNSTLEDNNTLIISEIRNTVFLPYSISDLEEQLKTSINYANVQEIIDNEYIIPLDRYKNAALSRFRESYNLMRKKERASITDSLDLALELTFNSLLNPAIITACKNLDELDIYLDCLNSNELDDFKIFNVKYEILPKK